VSDCRPCTARRSAFLTPALSIAGLAGHVVVEAKDGASAAVRDTRSLDVYLNARHRVSMFGRLSNHTRLRSGLHSAESSAA
jgi:hypothetical protein